MIFAISEEKGIEYYQLFDFSVNASRFVEYIINLRAANKTDKIAIFADNLSARKANIVKEKLIELDIKLIFNVPY